MKIAKIWRFSSPGMNKDALTIMATGSLIGQKLPLYILAK
jgi:hypothetical protein